MSANPGPPKPEGLSRRAFLMAVAAALMPSCSRSGTDNGSGYRVWGGNGFRDGLFVRPRAICANQGEVFVIDMTGRVQVFTEAGEFLRCWTLPESENGTPTGLTFGRNGNLLIPDTHYSRILEYTRNGEFVSTWGSYGTDQPGTVTKRPAAADADRVSPGRSPSGPMAGGDGTTMLPNAGNGIRNTAPRSGDESGAAVDGRLPENHSDRRDDVRFVYPTGIAQSPDGLLYVSEYGMGAEQVRVFDATRRPVHQWGNHGQAPGQFNRAMALAFDDTAGVFVADTANHRVQRFDPDGKLLAVIGTPGTAPGQLKFPHGLAIAPDGTVLVVEYGTHRVSQFSVDGNFIACHGGPGREPGRFNGPRGISVSAGGTAFVADTDNHRVQRFDYRAAGSHDQAAGTRSQ
ncbi:MAG: hypothetical protein AB1646_16315 [Thermodesulfobacteriota bacterium]